MFIVSVLIMLIVSFLLALGSLMKELKPPNEIKITKKEFMKEKILFRRD